MRQFRRAEEPYFEPPPRLATSMERRLSVNVAASWAERCIGGQWPRAEHYRRGEPQPVDCTGHSLMIDLRDPATPRIDTVDAAVAATFHLAPGPLLQAPPDSLGHLLWTACATLPLHQAPVPLEARLRTPDGEARLLTRGILLPLGDIHGGLGFAYAVLTWKELLGVSATERLQLELVGARLPTALFCRDASD